jgi:hypothetical protein
MRTLQALKDQAYHAKLQRLTGPSKDVEPQDMAGVDLAMAATLQQLAQQTGLQRQQVRVLLLAHAGTCPVCQRALDAIVCLAAGCAIIVQGRMHTPPSDASRISHRVLPPRLWPSTHAGCAAAACHCRGV